MLFCVWLFTTITFAQAKPSASKSAKKETPKVATSTPTKKDGTPDNRFKEKKTTPTATGPVKKDGTPDKRFKANKKS